MERSSKILLVEDEADTRMLLAELLEYYGFHVECVETAALAVAKLAHDCYSLVLADYITGSVFHAAREAHELLDAAAPGPVACLTGWSPVPEPLLQRFAFVMRKPFSPEALLADIARIVDVEPRANDEQKVLRYFDALTRKDWEGLAQLCSEDVTYRVTGHDPELSRVVVGRQHFKELSEHAFEAYPDARFEVRELAALPRGAVARYRGQWSAPHNEPVAMDAVVAFAFAEEQITQISVRIDLDRLRELQHPTDPSVPG